MSSAASGKGISNSSTKVYSSRRIERHCRQDIAYRVITANRVPDHATIARFVRRHERPLGELFGAVLGLCARAGLVASGVVAIDGTKLPANASDIPNIVDGSFPGLGSPIDRLRDN